MGFYLVVYTQQTDYHDRSILNIVGLSQEQAYLVDVVKINKCNHATLSQAVIQAVTDIEIVIDSAAYCIHTYEHTKFQDINGI